VAARLVRQIRSANPPGRFLKEDSENPGMFVEIGDQKAFKKAGQALREDAPEVRKVLDEEMEDVKHQPPPLPQHHHQQPMYHHHPGRGGMHHHPGGIPPSVSYSPTAAAAASAAPGQRPDPPESEGVTGYRQPPLDYYEGGGRGSFSGRGGGRGHFSRPQYPPTPMMHNMGGPPNQALMGGRGHPHHLGPPPNYYGHAPPPGGFSHSPDHPQQYPPHHGHYPQANGYGHPQQVGTDKDGRPLFNGPPKRQFATPTVASAHRDFPSLAKSTGTDFTMSDVSDFGASSTGMKNSLGPAMDPLHEGHADRIESEGTLKGSEVTNATKNSNSDKSRNSLGLSELSVSGLMDPNMSLGGLGFSFGASGRTRSFPDLMLSTGEPPLPAMHTGDSDKDNSDPSRKKKKKRGTRLLKPLHRHSSSESSSVYSMESLKSGFHNVRGLALSGLNDAMSTMSIDSRRSQKSDASWLEAYKSMQSITSDVNPWEGEGHNNSLLSSANQWADDGSVRSLLTDISNDLNALDLAEPLLPPYQTDSGLDDSNGFFEKRPDP